MVSFPGGGFNPLDFLGKFSKEIDPILNPIKIASPPPPPPNMPSALKKAIVRPVVPPPLPPLPPRAAQQEVKQSEATRVRAAVFQDAEDFGKTRTRHNQTYQKIETIIRQQGYFQLPCVFGVDAESVFDKISQIKKRIDNSWLDTPIKSLINNWLEKNKKILEYSSLAREIEILGSKGKKNVNEILEKIKQSEILLKELPDEGGIKEFEKMINKIKAESQLEKLRDVSRDFSAQAKTIEKLKRTIPFLKSIVAAKKYLEAEKKSRSLQKYDDDLKKYITESESKLNKFLFQNLEQLVQTLPSEKSSIVQAKDQPLNLEEIRKHMDTKTEKFDLFTNVTIPFNEFQRIFVEIKDHLPGLFTKQQNAGIEVAMVILQEWIIEVVKYNTTKLKSQESLLGSNRDAFSSSFQFLEKTKNFFASKAVLEHLDTNDSKLILKRRINVLEQSKKNFVTKADERLKAAINDAKGTVNVDLNKVTEIADAYGWRTTLEFRIRSVLFDDEKNDLRFISHAPHLVTTKGISLEIPLKDLLHKKFIEYLYDQKILFKKGSAADPMETWVLKQVTQSLDETYDDIQKIINPKQVEMRYYKF